MFGPGIPATVRAVQLDPNKPLPRAVWFGGVRYEVALADLSAGSAAGRCSGILQRIEIDPEATRNPQRLGQTWIHELLHAAFHEAGRMDLFGDEALVEPVSMLLHQALTRAEYDGDRRTFPRNRRRA